RLGDADHQCDELLAARQRRDQRPPDRDRQVLGRLDGVRPALHLHLRRLDLDRALLAGADRQQHRAVEPDPDGRRDRPPPRHGHLPERRGQHAPEPVVDGQLHLHRQPARRHGSVAEGRQAAAAACAGSTSRRYCPVNEPSTSATSSGVPVATISPPASPPSGPRSISQSACLITSRLCSITSTVFPASTSRWRTSSSFSMSAKCRPVVGSSSMYSVLPVATFDSSFESFTRCASPPDRVVAGWPSLM